MNALLDTHAFLWAISAPERLGRGARSALSEPGCLQLSVASLWECVVKFSLGKLKLPHPPLPYLTQQAALNQVGILHILVPHLASLQALPWLHRDPFDRILVAQARAEHVCLISADPQLEKYGIHVVW